MYTGTDFTPAAPGEDEPYGFDFEKALVAGETISSASFTLRRQCDSADFSHKLTRDVEIAGTRVTRYVTNIPPGRYRLSCIVQTNVGRHELHSYIPCF